MPMGTSSSAIQTTTLRVIAALSIGTGVFWVAGLISDVLLGFELSANSLAVFVTVAAVLLVALPMVVRSRFLEAPASIRARRFGLTLAAAVLATYLSLVPVFALFGWCLVLFSVGDGSDHSETSILIGLIALWLPLWWAPGVGAWAAWRVLRRREHDSPTPA
jgi:hypothetical protein